MKKQILKTVYTLLCCIFLFIPVIQSKEKPLELQINPYTGAISGLKIPGDKQNMEWLVKTDGSQYAWIKEDYGWGLGYFTVDRDRKSLKREWSAPTEISRDGMNVVYREADIRIQIKRRFSEKDLIEQYTFTNEGKEEAFLHDIGIYTPFNDNYPNAKQCINERTHAHIWEGENAAYVNALRMGAFGPHLGMVLTKGSVKSYEIWERGRKKANSQTRGIIALNPINLVLKPGESYSLQWNLFVHNGNEDFRRQLLERGSVIASCPKYIYP